jgi:hypothetical protein
VVDVKRWLSWAVDDVDLLHAITEHARWATAVGVFARIPPHELDAEKAWKPSVFRQAVPIVDVVIPFQSVLKTAFSAPTPAA